MKQIILLVMGIGAGLYVLLAGMYAMWDLPKADSLQSFRYRAATQVFDRNDEAFAKLFEQNRVPVSLGEMSAYLPMAIVANEDTRFESHLGIDPIGIMRSLLRNIKAGEIVEGGSTVTQQLAREMFLTQERTMTRKLKEALLALVLEQKFTKAEIMEAYLNQVYFGEGAYGVEAASQAYFKKSARELTLAESALIAGLARGPRLFSPYRDMDAAKSRRAVVLAEMQKIGYISEGEEWAANQEPIPIFEQKKREVEASYFLDYVAQMLVEKYGEERVYQGGLKVYTTLDLAMQKEAESVLKEREGAVLILDVTNGAIRAMVGGRSYGDSQRNRVIEEVRQPGSAFKPIVYAAALMQGMRTNSMVQDVQGDFNGYRPSNYNNVYLGPITLKRALKNSSNVASVRLGKQVGIDAISAVRIEEAFAVFVGSEIEIQRPRAPEQVDVAVTDATVSKINKTREAPTVIDNVRQAIIAVQKRIVAEQMSVALQKCVNLFGSSVSPKSAKIGNVILPFSVIFLGSRKILYRMILDGAIRKIGLVEHA